MRKQNPIDDLFYKHLANNEEAYPKHLWSDVERRINDTNSARGSNLYLVWSAFIIILLAIGSIGYWTTTMGEKTTNVEFSDSKVLEKTGEELTTTIDGTARTDQSLNNNGIQTNNADTDDASSTSSVNSIESQSTQRHDDDIQSKPLIDTKNEIKTTTQKSFSPNSRTNKNQGNSKDAIAHQASDSKAKYNRRDDNQAKNSGSQELRGENEVLGKTSRSAKDAGTVSTNRGGSNSKQAFSQTRAERMIYDDMIPLRNSREVNAIEKLETSYGIGSYINKGIGYGKNRWPVHWSVGLTYSADIVNRKMEARTDYDVAYVNHRQDKEQLSNAFTTGVRIEARMREWSITTGLSYSQINERYIYEDDNAMRVIDGVPVQGALRTDVVNRYRFLEIPLSLGYRIRAGAFFIDLKGGVAMNIATYHEGELYNDQTGMNEAFGKDQDFNPFADQVPIAISGSVGLGYKFGYFSEVFIEPYYKKYTGSITQDDFATTQQYTATGLTFGLRHIIR